MFSADTKKKCVEVKERKGVVPVFLAAVLILLVAATNLWAIPLEEAAIFIEINDTDGDGGVQIFVDAEGWMDLQVYDPDGELIFDVIADGSVGETGITELMFESAEPSFEDLPLEDLLARFPEGKYDFEATTVEETNLMRKATLSHAIPAAPDIVSPGEEDEVSVDAADIVWEPVTDPYPGTYSSVNVVGYQVIVERETPKSVSVFSVDLPADATEVRVPSAFLESKTTYKFEILAIEAGGNKTISESEFTTE